MARLLLPEFISAALKTQAALHPRPRSTTCCSMPDFAVKWESLAITSRIGIGNWVSVIPGTTRKPSLVALVSAAGLREALLDTNPATAFNPFLGFLGRNTEAAISRVYVTLHNTGQFELPLAYFHLDGELFNLPAGPVSFATGLKYRGERWRNDPDSENASFDTIGGRNFQASKVNRDVWGTFQEVRIPVTSPAWKLPGAYSLEFDIAEREEWYSQNTSATTAPSVLPEEHSQFDATEAEIFRSLATA